MLFHFHKWIYGRSNDPMYYYRARECSICGKRQDKILSYAAWSTIKKREKRMEICYVCQGTGITILVKNSSAEWERFTCSKCGGTGKVMV